MSYHIVTQDTERRLADCTAQDADELVRVVKNIQDMHKHVLRVTETARLLTESDFRRTSRFEPEVLAGWKTTKHGHSGWDYVTAYGLQTGDGWGMHFWTCKPDDEALKAFYGPEWPVKSICWGNPTWVDGIDPDFPADWFEFNIGKEDEYADRSRRLSEDAESEAWREVADVF